MSNTNAGSKIYICTTPAPVDLTAVEYEALTWLPVRAVGNYGQSGTATNLLTYNTYDTNVAQKAKGLSNAGDPALEVARIPTDPGQQAVRAAARTPYNYPIRVDHSDGTIFYNRGVITGPTRLNGKVEDFDLEIYTFGFNQFEISLGADHVPAGFTLLIGADGAQLLGADNAPLFGVA